MMTETPDSASGLSAGTLVDHFKVVRLAGRGGMGVVYLARDTKLGRKVALKLINAAAVGSSRAVERFLTEARLTARFNHPHIVTVYAVGEHEGQPYVALEYLEGQTLRRRMSQQRMGVREIARVGLAIGRALQEAHGAGILHRDLKPENVIVPGDGRLRVVDFGLAKLVREPTSVPPTVIVRADAPPREESGSTSSTMRCAAPSTQASADRCDGETVTFAPTQTVTASASMLPGAQASNSGLAGTPAYMAPEQWLAAPCSPATDMWALGVMLFELLAEEHPFHWRSLVELRSQVCSDEPVPGLPTREGAVPIALEELVMGCLDRDPNERPTASQAVAVFEQLVGTRHLQLEEDVGPFRGLQPFTESNSPLFFGRDDDLTAFRERLRNESLLVLVGPSGAGKTSFVQAGLIPLLREQRRWNVVGLRPGRRPFDVLASRLLQARSLRSSRSSGVKYADSAQPRVPTTERNTLRNGLMASPSLLALHLAALAEQTSESVLLFVDQLEELFTLVEDAQQRRAFVSSILAAGDDPDGNVRVVLAVRDDFFVRLSDSASNGDVLRHIAVLRKPNAEALREIVMRPVSAAGYRFETDSLVDELVEAVEGEDACLPLLQSACARLWEMRHREARVLTNKAYRDMGGVEGALATQADAALDGLSAAQLQAARTLFLRLITPEGTRRVLSREALLEGLPPDASELLHRFVDVRTLSARKGPDGEAEIELVHESLIRGWRQLRRWVDESREEVAFLTEVGQAAELWERRGHRKEEVWRGDALRDALRRARHVEALPERIGRFLDAGEALAKSKTRRNRIILAFVITGLVIVAATLAAMNQIAREQRAHADEQRQLADERRELAEREQAVALREGARAAVLRGDLLGARARLRASMETQDSPLARALWWQLGQEPLRWRESLGTSISEVAISHDGNTIAAAGMDAALYLLDVDSGALRLLRGHAANDAVYTLDISPDGSLLVSGTMGGDVRVWDIGDGRHRALVGHEDVVQVVRFSPDGSTIATGGSDRTLRLWDAKTGVSKKVIEGFEGAIYSVEFHPTQPLLAAVDGRVVRLWRLPGGEPAGVLRGRDSMVTHLLFSPDGSTLASLSSDGVVRLERVSDLTQTALWRTGESASWALAYSPDGRWIATGSHDGVVSIRDTRTGAISKVLRDGTAHVNVLAFGPLGRYLVSGGQDRAVRLWDLRTDVGPGFSRSLGDDDNAHEGGVYTVAFSPDGGFIVSTGMDETVRLWSVKTGSQEQVLRGHSARVFGAAVAPKGDILASSSSDRTIRLWDTASGRELAVLEGHEGEVYQVAFSHDGGTLASASADRTVRLWDVASHSPLRVLRGHSDEVHDIGFSRDGRSLVSASDDATARLWDVATGRSRHVLRGHDGWVWSSRFVDSKHVVTGGWDNTVRRWDVASGQGESLGMLDGQSGWLDIDPSQNVLVPTSKGSCHHFDAASHRWTRIRAHRNRVWSVSFSADGKWFATGSQDATVRLWDASTLRPAWYTTVLLRQPRMLLTQEGWTDYGDVPTKESESWLAAKQVLERDARKASQSHDGASLCVETWTHDLVHWNLASGRHQSLGQEEDTTSLGLEEDIASLLALPEACVVMTASGSVLRIDLAGEPQVLENGATALGSDGGEPVVAANGMVIHYDVQGREKDRMKADVGVSALMRNAEHTFLGYADGSLEVLGRSSEERKEGVRFEDLPSARVEQIAPGPMSTVAAGYSNGTVGVWNTESGTRLVQARLHGPVTHLLVEEGVLVAATDVGDHVRIDLGVLRQEYCDVMRLIWEDVPVVWESGLALVKKPPDTHPCRRH